MSASAGAELLDYISWPSVECLNAQPAHGAANALKQGYREDDGLWLESDTDEQLLLHIQFNQAVKLSGLVIKAEAGGTAPRTVKLFTNQPSLGFSEAASERPTQEFALSDDDLVGRPLTLRFVKFQNVTTLSVFIEDNRGGEDTTRVQKISLLGQPAEKMDVAAIKKVGEEEG
ncbi:hypothetical protein WJX81_003107 [Elliptochloris bilobata]|uniref:PITH domain-containing protein n=1 Tax=Elliptochloris bilobata TaxID=381761 RepID=A0AAW1QIX9_9CHLO